MKSFLKRKYDRVSYYVRNFVADALPYSIYENRLRNVYSTLLQSNFENSIFDRVNHYNRLSRGSKITGGIKARDIPLEASYYYYDLKEFLNYFSRELILRYKFGDLNHLLEQPSICKTRPICDGNSNSVLFKLDKLRHFRMDTDLLRYSEKQKACVWRGSLNNAKRIALVKKFANSERHNIGHIGAPIGHIEPKDFMTIGAQFAYRYIISIEGYDVATNLKSVLGSQSLCLMPKPTIESWFMESRLRPGIHYVELRDDFSDLEDQIYYYDRHEDEALEIIRNANAHTKQFADARSESVISILVLQKYFESLGQIPFSPFSRLFWAD